MKTVRAVLIAAVAGGFLALPVAAQQGPPGPRGGMRGPGPMERGGMLGARIELALEHSDVLGLDEEQTRALREMSEELASQREGIHEQMAELREQARSGDVAPNTVRERMEALRSAAREAHEPYRERFDELLDEEQEEELSSLLRTEMRRGRRGPGMRGRRGRPGGGPAVRCHGARLGLQIQRGAFLRGFAMGRGLGPAVDGWPFGRWSGDGS